MSLALLCSCGGDGDREAARVDTGVNTTEAGSNHGGAQSDGGTTRLDGGPDRFDGGAAQSDSGQNGAGAFDGSDGSGARDGGAGGGPMDAAPEAGTSEDAGRDAGPLTLNGYPEADHCAPGEYDPMYNPFCEDLDGGMESALAAGLGATPSLHLSVRWRKLAAAMRAHEPYAISVEIALFQPPASHQLEIWGTMSPCASGGEPSDRLGLVPLDRGTGVYCVDMLPTKPYSHVMIAYRKTGEGNGSGTQGQTYCSTGMCPAR